MKHSNFTVAFVIAIFLMISGCASVEGKKLRPSASPDSSTVKASFHRESAGVWERYSLHSIEGVPVEDIANPDEAVFKVEPGRRLFTIYVNLSSGLLNSLSMAYIPIEAVLQPRVTYQIRGEVSGDDVAMWLEDEQTKECVSKRESTKLYKEPFEMPWWLQLFSNTYQMPMPFPKR